MPFLTTPIEGVIICEPRLFKDDRGYFYESFNKRTFAEGGIDVDFVQDNQARSTYGVLRGLHYQVGEDAQSKLVRVLEGAVLDVVVDLREGSATYGKWFSIELSAENHRQLFVPRGFAHGYLCLTPDVLFVYKCDNYYAKEAEGGLCWNDPALAIDWGIPVEDILLSDKDKVYPAFGDHRKF